jgi:hypothetical protein
MEEWNSAVCPYSLLLSNEDILPFVEHLNLSIHSFALCVLAALLHGPLCTACTTQAERELRVATAQHRASQEQLAHVLSQLQVSVCVWWCVCGGGGVAPHNRRPESRLLDPAALLMLQQQAFSCIGVNKTGSMSLPCWSVLLSTLAGRVPIL